MVAHETADQSVVNKFMQIHLCTNKTCNTGGPQMATSLHIGSGSTQGISCKFDIKLGNDRQAFA